MDFRESDEQSAIRAMVRELAEKEIRPGVAHREKTGEFPAEVIAKLGELGLLGVMVPEEYGGAGLDATSYVIAVEELARVCASTAVTMSVNNSVFCYPVLKFGTEEQKTTILREVASGAALGGYMLTEPQSGSDAANQRPRAEKTGDRWILNGAKAWITNAGVAKWFVVMARTGGEGTKGISGFLVDAATPGFRVGAPEDKMGLRASKTAMVFLEDVEVPETNLLGSEGQGFKIAMTTLDHSRIGIAAQAVGIAQSCYELAAAYAEVRETFGKKLWDHQAVAFRLADLWTEIQAARLLTYRAAWLSEQPGAKFSAESSAAKLFASETANSVAARAVQIFGGYGYSKEYEVERLYRDVRVTTIYEGTSEIQRMVIAKNLQKKG
ncbi:MAG: acyl-CoA dehydrogenase family protein [Acidobacteria bacterium]|nr:acyl-CoA dehydrogenase family protein [Acidobacteriota bacterium]